MPVEHIHDLPSFHAAVRTPKKLVVVDFHATWCGPCHAIAPFYESLANQYAARARFLKVDVDEAEEVARYSAVSAMPTFHFYRDGRRQAEFSGADQAKLQAEIERLAPSAAEVSFYGAGKRLGDTAGVNANASASTAAAGSMREALAAAAAKRFQDTKPVKDEEKENPEANAAEKVLAGEAGEAGTAADGDVREDNEAEKKPQVETEAPVQNDSRLKVNETYLKQLVDEMGFPKIRAEKALILTGNQSVEQAVEWCFQHADDADIDEPLQVVTSEGAAKPKLSPEEAKQKAEELYARARSKREEEEKVAVKEREKERLRSSKEVTTAKAKLEEDSRKRAVEEKRREKREALLERQRVRQMLEADKARRREKFNMPGASQPAPAQPEPPKEVKREPTASAGKIQFRLPDGSRIEGEFQAEHTMGDLITFLVEKKPELGLQALQFSQQYPRKTFSASEYGVSLVELKLLPRGALTVTFA